MEIIIKIEDSKPGQLKILCTPSFARLSEIYYAGKATPAVEAAMYALLKIRQAQKDAEKGGKIIKPGDALWN